MTSDLYLVNRAKSDRMDEFEDLMTNVLKIMI